MSEENIVADEEVSAPEEEVTATTEPEAEPEAQEPESEKSFSQKDVDDIVRRRVAKEQRRIEKNVRLEVENQMLRDQLKPTAEVEKEPQRNQFKNDEDYFNAILDYRVEQKLNEKMNVLDERQEVKQTELTTKQAQEKWSEVESNARDKFPQYDELVEPVYENQKFMTKPGVGEALQDSKHAPEILMHLGANPKELERIANLDPIPAARAIWELEAKVSTPIKKPDAPKPISPLSGGKSQTKSLEEAGMDEYIEMRKKQGARWA